MHTAQDYDAVPYEDCPLIQTRPDSLGLIARLFGIESAPPDKCRVLELGCASGGNLIPLAYYWPGSEFVGVELSEKQAELGNNIIREMQLSNISLLHRNILDLDETLGTFDYIIAHGVYSWVPADVQNHMMKLIPRILLPNGIAYISYNTFPGWHFRMAIRDMMLFPSLPEATAEQKRDNGLEMLKKLAKGLPDDSSLSEKWMKKEAERLLQLPASYLLHDYLENNNNPVYFSQFMEKAEENGMRFLSEADLYTMLGSTLTQEAENQLDAIEDLIELQQYMDFYYLRSFRQTLLCHDNMEIDYELDLDMLKKYFFFTILNCNEEIDLHSEGSQAFTHPKGESFDISHPLTKAAIVALSHAFPNGYSYQHLLDASQQILLENNSEFVHSNPNEMLQELFNLYLSQGLEISQVRREFPGEAGDRPKANRLARIYAKYHRCCIGSMHHGNISFGVFDQYFLSLLDGKHSVSEIAQSLVDKINNDESFRNTIQQQGKDTGGIISDPIAGTQQSLYFYSLNGFLEQEPHSQ